MLIFIVVIAFGYNGLFFMQSKFSGNYYGGYTSWGAEDFIREAQERKYEGWEQQVELYEYYRDNGIPVYYRYGDPDAWRQGAVNQMFSMKWNLAAIELSNTAENNIAELQGYLDDIDTAIKTGDWRKYYQSRIDFTEAVYGEEIDHWFAADLEGTRLKLLHDAEPGDWKDTAIDQMRWERISLAQYGDTSNDPETTAMMQEIKDRITLIEYRLEHNIESYTYDGVESLMNSMFGGGGYWSVFASSVSVIGILSVLIIIIAGSLLSSEFSAGTVKFLLINPVKRWKIFAAKYITVLSMTFAMLLVLYVFNALFAALFFGVSDIGMPYLSVTGGEVVRGSSYWYVASKYLLGAVGTVCLGTFAFMVSSLVRSSALAIGLSVFLYFSGSMAVLILNQGFGLYQAKYILFANTNINNVLAGTTGFVNHTLAFAVINIAVYMFVFLLTAWDGFVRGDVK
jgi:ABC-2 type transport system permease protein